MKLRVKCKVQYRAKGCQNERVIRKFVESSRPQHSYLAEGKLAKPNTWCKVLAIHMDDMG